MGRLIVGDDVVRLSVVGTLARRRWRLIMAFAVVGAVIGFGLSFVLSPGHLAASKVLLKGQPDKNQLLTETQVAMSLVVLDRVAEDLQWGVAGIELQDHVGAEVLDGNVLQITGVAATPERARALTDRAAAEYVLASTQILNDTRKADENAQRRIHDAGQKRVDDLRARLATAQERALQTPSDDATSEVARLTTELSAAENELAQRDRQAAQRADEPSSSGTATILEPALDRGRAAPTPVQLVAGGAVVLPVLALYGLLWHARRGGWLRDHDQIAAALGAPVLADVSVSASDLPASTGSGSATRRGEPTGDRRGGAETAWVDQHDLGETIRYRRVLHRLGGADDGPLALLAVVPRDDGAAQAAVVALAAVAAAERGPVRLVVDDPGVVELYRPLVPDGRRVLVTAAGGDESGATVLRLVGVEPARPTVPDGLTDRAVLLVTGLGTRTSGELVDIAGACHDAGAPLTGAVLVTVAAPAPSAGPVADRPPPAAGGRSADALVAGPS
jgi:hypothetical protein